MIPWWKVAFLVGTIQSRRQGGSVRENTIVVAADGVENEAYRQEADFIDHGLWLGGVASVPAMHNQECAIVDCRLQPGAKQRFADRRPTSWLAVDENVQTLKDLAARVAKHRQEGRPVYVHCAHGKNRGPASMLAYLMLYEGCDMATAMERVKQSRPQCRTWDNTFILALKQIAKEIQSPSSVSGAELAA